MMQIPNHTKGAPEKISIQPKEICEGCAKGKSIRQPHPLLPEHAKKPNKIVYSDVYTLPVNTYKSNIKYIVTFLDNATLYCRMFFIAHKDKTFDCFKKYVNWSKRQTSRKLKTIRSDHDREFMSKEFQVYLDESGISREISIPHIHQQNGCIERIQRTIHKKAEAIRKHAGIRDMLQMT
jgi:phosphomevalonate kinase